MTGGHRPTPGQRGRLRLAAAAVAGLLAAACGPAPASQPVTGAAAAPGPAAGAPPRPAAAIPARPRPPVPPDPSGSPSRAGAAGRGARPLAGTTVGIDPGHNGDNGANQSFIGHLVWNGAEMESCDTTGTQTESGYTEARFNFNVAGYLRAYLRRDGARVVMTRDGNRGAGPCVNRRAQIINQAHAQVAIDIHADGGPSWGRGFTVLEPVADGPNDKVTGASARLAREVRSALLARTPMPASDYYGQAGLISRDDLAGLNLTRVPKILIECGNMRNAADARLLTSPGFQRRIARALLAAVVAFVR